MSKSSAQKVTMTCETCEATALLATDDVAVRDMIRRFRDDHDGHRIVVTFGPVRQRP